MVKYQKTHMITFRVTEAEYRELRNKAPGNLSSYCRRLILRDEDIKRTYWRSDKIKMDLQQEAFF